MMFFVYLLLAAGLVYFISRRKDRGPGVLIGPSGTKAALKAGSQEFWKQVYETASVEEARMIRARLTEEGIECVLYEQGKKDIHGNLLKGVGVAVPGTAASRAQDQISKMPV